jgi:hypothetical protein
MRMPFRIPMKKILVIGFALALSGCGIAARSSVQRSDMGINQAYLGCLMYRPDILECSDLRWGAKLALYNEIKPQTGVSVTNIEKVDKAIEEATSVKTSQASVK